MIRKVGLKDAEAIADIYNGYVRESVITFDTEPLPEEEMRKYYESGRALLG